MSRTALRIGSLALLAVLLPVAAAESQSFDLARGNVSVRVAADRPQHPVSPRLFGSNLQWEHSGDGILLANDPSRPAPAVLGAMRDAGITLLRFPGGDLANTYRWRNGVGAHDLRGKGKTYDGSEGPSTFGTDELLTVCERAKVEPMFTVNVSAGEEEAAAWVEYVNGARTSEGGRKRVANGHAAPANALYWEIGNELYSPNQPGHRPAAAYGATVRRFAAAMKAKDPGIKIGADLEGSFVFAPWLPKVLPHLVTWNESVLREAGKDMDFVVLHYYAPHDRQWDDVGLRAHVLAGPEVFAQTLQRVVGLLNRYGRPNTEIVLSEFGTAFADKLFLSKRIGSTEGALYSASVLLAAMREPRVTVANHWSLLNNSQFGMLVGEGSGFRTRPIFDVYRLIKRWQGGRILPLTLEGPGYSVPGLGSIPALPRVPLADALAVLEVDGSVSIALINRSDRHALPARVVLDGLAPGPRQLARTTLAAAPAASQWQIRTEAPTAFDPASLQTELPPHSFSLLTIGPPDRKVKP